MSKLVCYRLPATIDTLAFISEILMRDYVREGVDDALLTPFGAWRFFELILSGEWRCYGAFELSDEDGSVLGFPCLGFGHLTDDKTTFVWHTVGDRHAPIQECCRLGVEVMKAQYAREGITVKAIAGEIPDCNRASRLSALRFGMKAGALNPEKLYYKHGKSYPCREYRKEIF